MKKTNWDIEMTTIEITRSFKNINIFATTQSGPYNLIYSDHPNHPLMIYNPKKDQLCFDLGIICKINSLNEVQIHYMKE